MNIAIVIHTSSGHTLKFAQAIREQLASRGHTADILGLRAIGKVAPNLFFGGGNFTIKSPPELDEYDAALFGGPVWAFKASPVVMKYLNEDVKSLKGKKALSFVTYMCAGAGNALRMMDGELEAAGADVLEGERLTYFLKADGGKMLAAAERICGRLAAGAGGKEG
jgi:flavodoxin